KGHATVGRGEPAEIRPSTLDARGDGVDRGANVNRLDTLGAELVLQHALHPVRTPPLLPVAIDRGVELLDRTRALVGREERAAPVVKDARLQRQRARRAGGVEDAREQCLRLAEPSFGPGEYARSEIDEQTLAGRVGRPASRNAPAESDAAPRLLQPAALHIENGGVARSGREVAVVERALEHLPVKGLRAGGLTERVAGAREVPDRRDLEDLVPVPARELPRLGAARGHALPVAIEVLEERSRGVDRQRIIAPGFAQRAARFLELPAPGTRGGEHVEQDLPPDVCLGETGLGQLTLDPEACIARALELAAARGTEPGGEERCLVVQRIRDLPGALEESETLGDLTRLAHVPPVKRGRVRPQALVAELLRDLHRAPRGRQPLLGADAPERRRCDADVQQRLRGPLGPLAENRFGRAQMLARAADVHR